MRIPAAGDLRHSIVINARTDERGSDYGDYAESYAEYCTCRAAITFIPGNETIQNETIANTSSAQFTIRYRSAVNEKMQIVWDGSTWDIRSIEYDERKFYMAIMATKLIN